MDKMHSCGSKKGILDELGLHECNQNDSKICAIMYKKLHKEHLLLQRSFAAVRQSLNETLCKSQVSKEYNSSLQQRKRIKTEFDGLKRQSESIDLNSKEKPEMNDLPMLRFNESKQLKKIEENSQMHSCDQIKLNDCKHCNHVQMSAIPAIMYKKLCREHLILQRTFATVCQSFNEALDKSQRPKEHISNAQQKKFSKKEFDELKRQIELLSIELQEARDQNELFEFRIHELEQIKGSTKSKTLDENSLMVEKSLKTHECQHHFNERIACLKCSELESQLLDANKMNHKLNEKFNASKRALHELINKYALKEELENLLLKNCRQNNDSLKVAEPEIGYIGSAMTSEDEGLGDDTRRDHSSGPSSLADLQEPEFDALSIQSPQSPLQFEEAMNVSFYQNDKCKLNDNQVIEQLARTRGKQTASTQTDGDEFFRTRTIESHEYIEKLEHRLNQLKKEKADLEEQVLELEEAENDSRLLSQRLQQQLETFLDQYETMHSDLINTKKTIDHNNNKIKTFERIEFELRSQIGEMRNAIMKQCLTDTNRNENCILDESNKCIQPNDDLINRLTVPENDGKHLQQQLHRVDGLYSFLWEKLYKLEKQIDSYKESFGESKQYFSSQDSDDDLQLFISAEKLSEGVSNIGSSFDVSQFDSNSRESFQENCLELHKHCDATVRLDDLVLSLPLCETVKPERIDVMINSSPKIRPTSPQCLPSDIISKINKLETNEQLLRERLLQLEWINKEFVRELELREKIFFEREKKHKEWLVSENEFKQIICELQSEKNSLEIKVKDLETERNNLIEEISSLRNVFEEMKHRHQNELKDTKNEQNIIVIDLQKHLTELESKEREFLTQMQSIECNKTDQQNKLKQLNDNYALLKQDLQKERENIIKFKDDFATQLNHLINNHISRENELEQKIEELETQESISTTKLKDLSEREQLLKNILMEKENELKKFQCTHEERIKILEEEHKLVEKELKMKMEEMESKTSTTVNELEIERNKIHKQLEEAFNNIKCKEFEYTKKINELSENVDKLESKLLKLVNNKSNFEKKDNEKTQLKMKIASIQSSEEELRKRLSEMMQKEAAYEETLSKADKIIATLEHNYKQRIEELETSERNLKTKITQMEDVETRLRSALRPERRTSDSYRKASDLVKELIDAETRECTLREQIRALEISVNQFEQQLTEANQRKIHLETELKDQDELVSTVVNLQQEIESLKKDLNKSLQTQDSLQDMLKETEKYCLQRDEEMHIKYKSLEDEKCDLEITIQHLKHRLRHENALNHSYDSLSITDNYKSIELSLNNNDNSTQDIKQCCESLSFDTKSINNEELEDARLNMEKCLKRAMAVVRMEMRQKDQNENLSSVDTEEAYSSLSLSSSPYSSDECEKSIQDFQVLMDETTDSSSPSSSSALSLSSFTSRNISPLPPKNFKIIRQVSADSLLIGWQKHNKDDILGYQIVVNEEIVQKVRNPKATKALINKLDLSKSFLIKIVTISFCGNLSNEIAIRYTPTDSSANL